MRTLAQFLSFVNTFIESLHFLAIATPKFDKMLRLKREVSEGE